MNILPDVTLTVEDGGLGLLPTASDQVVAIVGPSSSGAAGAVSSVASYDALQRAFGAGPLVDAAAVSLASGAAQVLCVRVPSSTSANVVASALAVTVQGTPTRDAVLTVTVSSTAGVSLAREGRSASRVGSAGTTINVADVGIAFVAAAGDYTATITCTAARASAADSIAALRALLQDPREWGTVLLAGVANPAIDPTDTADVAAAFDLAAAAQAVMDEARQSHRYASAIVDAPNLPADALIAAAAAHAFDRVVVAYGSATIVHPAYMLPAVVPTSALVAAKYASAPISEDFGRVASGSLPSVLAVSHDERQSPGLDAARFTTLRTFVGLPGFYMTAGRTFAAPGSDYEFVQHRRVMDRACKLARAALLPYVNESVRVDEATGGIDEGDARDIETSLESTFDADLVGARHVTRAKASVVRTDAILQTKSVRVSLNIVPKGYIRAIAVTLSFVNPALAQAAD